jgi:hypothetical protein
MHRHRDHHIAVLRHVLGSRRREVHPFSGAQDVGSLGVPPGEEERENRYQRQNFPGQDRGNIFAQHVLGWGARRQKQLRGGNHHLPNRQTLGGQAAQGLYEITLREEFARLNELTGSLTLTSGVQETAGDKSIVDSLEGTVVWWTVTPLRAHRPWSGCTEA